MEVGDDEECWVQLEDYRLLLIKTIDPTRITPYLRQCKVLSAEDEEQIFNDPNLVVRRRKVGVLLDILQRTGMKGYVAFLESLELDYPGLYRKITGKEPARVFSILVDTAGESGLTHFLMSEVTRLQKLVQDVRRARQEALVAKHEDTVRKLQVTESELGKQQGRVQRMREERDRQWEEGQNLKEENYGLMRDVTRLSEEKNNALMCNRDLQLEIERLKHSLMKAESDSKIELKNAMEQKPSPDMMLELQRQNDLLKAHIQELESSSKVTRSVSVGHEKPNLPALEPDKQQHQAQPQELVNNLYMLRQNLHEAEELRDKYLEERDVLELRCKMLRNDSKIYHNRMEDILQQMDEVIRERDKAISSRGEYIQENSQHLQDKDQYRKQIRVLREQCDELQVKLLRTQGEALHMQICRQKYSPHASSEFSSRRSSSEQGSQTTDEDSKERICKGISEELHSLTSGEFEACIALMDPSPLGKEKDDKVAKRPSSDEDFSTNNKIRQRCNFYYRRKRALRTKVTKEVEGALCVLDNSSGSETDGM